VALLAIQALGLVGAKAESAVPALTQRLDDASRHSRKRRESFGQHRSAGSTAVTGLARLKSDSDESVRNAAIGALDKIDSAAHTM